MAHQLEHDIAVAIDTGALALTGKFGEDFLDVSHVKVTTQAEVLGPPVITAQERVYVRQPALACGRVSEVAHVELAGKG